MQGWIDNILLYDFTTEYLPGDKNELADALSRKDELGDHSTLEIRGISMEEKEMFSDTDKQLLHFKPWTNTFSVTTGLY